MQSETLEAVQYCFIYSAPCFTYHTFESFIAKDLYFRILPPTVLRNV